ncbi:MAG: FAD-dependent oxidoreductase [Firmicutes bacterium]|nr:FAD-dependent oxidoreductase [Bacillota bacterium]
MQSYEYDVVVIGGGVTGVCAALAASGSGVKTLLLEKNQYLGGMATGGWVHSCLTFHSRLGYRIVDGIPQEIFDKLAAIGGTTGHVRDTVGVAYSVTPFDPDKYKFVLQSCLNDQGVDYLFDTFCTNLQMEGNRIKSVQCCSAHSRFEVKAPVFIDATGDGHVAFMAGNDFEMGRDGYAMPATLIFKVRNVNFKPILRYMWKHMDDFHDETRFDLLKSSPALGVSGFFRLWKMANLSVPRDRLLFYQTMHDDEVAINSTRVQDFNPHDPQSWKKALVNARMQMYEILDFIREWIPGFGFCRFTGEAPQLGIREVRRIIGRYMLSGEDVKLGRRFDDEIAFGGFPVDIHLPQGNGIETQHTGDEGFYGIPFRCLQPLKGSNLLVAGKCFSSKFEAHASARVQATVMAMGQAAGAAASVAVKKKTDPGELDVKDVREQILNLGGLLQPAGREDLP